jgi:hypothetical protein
MRGATRVTDHAHFPVELELRDALSKAGEHGLFIASVQPAEERRT